MIYQTIFLIGETIFFYRFLMTFLLLIPLTYLLFFCLCQIIYLFALCVYIYIYALLVALEQTNLLRRLLFFSLSLSVFILIICMHTSYLIIKRIKTMCTFIIIILFEINSLIDFNHFFSIKDKNLFD